ncbi:MAG: FecR domain-containing protein [Chthoniobacterales bacterium]
MKAPQPAAAKAAMSALLALLVCVPVVTAALDTTGWKQARLTRVIKDVTVLAPPATSRKAVLNDSVPEGGAIRTGVSSRTEVTFASRSVARLGANTFVRLKTGTLGTRDLQLEDGAVLFDIAPGARATNIKTAGITAEIAGTTGMIERFGRAYVKILILQGEARVYLSRVGESVLIGPGKLLITKPEAKILPEAVDYEIGQLYKTSLLTNSDFAPLPSRNAILAQIRKQESDPNFIRTNLVIYGRGTLVNLVPTTETAAPSTRGSASVTPAPSPSKRGPKR